MSNSYHEYICKGVHCKCMNLDGKCPNYHNGDHTCPTNNKGVLVTSANYKQRIRDLFNETLQNHSFYAGMGCVADTDYFMKNLEHILSSMSVQSRIDEHKNLWSTVPVDANHVGTVKDISSLMVVKLEAQLTENEK